MKYLIEAVVCVLAGGYGGYAIGRQVEAKAQAVAAALKQGATAISTAVKK